MPELTRAFIKTSLLYLVASFVVAAMQLLSPVVALPRVGALQPVFLHLLMVGWVTQLIFGVVFWMFPKLTREAPRGSERLGWATYAALNAGLLLRVVGEPWQALTPNSPAAWLLPLSALLQLAAGWLFVTNSWGRVKGK